MSFIDEVNAIDLGQKAKAKAPLIVAGAVVLLLAGGAAAYAALQPPVMVVDALSQGAETGDDVGDDGEGVAAEGDEPSTANGDETLGGSSSESVQTSAASTAAAKEEICVHVGGCVAVPGLYRMAMGSRIDDVVRAAGGMTGEAAEDAVNLAAVLEDGQQVIVPSRQQVAEGQWGQSAVSGAATSTSSASGEGGSAASGGPLNVNRATAEQLTQLNGIGEALAQRIVADRDKNGPFSSVDNLTRVSGIGEKKLEGFRDDVCV